MMPERKNTIRNLFPPILRSSSGPKKNKNIILNKRCIPFACRNICVTRVHGLEEIFRGSRAR
jgi:hypothetical protein